VHSMQPVPTPSLTPPKATSKTMPPMENMGGSIASSELRKRTQKRKTLDAKCWGKLTYITRQKTKYMGPPR
jgi:hypothetical protein